MTPINRKFLALQRNIIILTDSPISKRDYERFGIEILQQYFTVSVFDCTPWLKPCTWRQYSGIIYPCSQYNIVHNWDEFIRNMEHISQALAIDYLGNGRFSKDICNALRDHEILRVNVYNGALPTFKLTTLQKIKVSYREGNIFRRISSRLLSKIHVAECAALPGDIVLLAGEADLKGPYAQARHKIWAHSFDYDLYLNLRDRTSTLSKPYAVFIDQDLAYHSDFDYSSTIPPVTAEKYYPSLLAFFDMFERITGIDVIFAAHPRSRYDLRPHLLSGRVPVLGSTAELIRDAAIVMTHGSTSISFAVLWRKPIVFLTSNELERSRIGYGIASFGNLSNVPLINIDNLNELTIDFKRWLRFEECAYSNYQKKHIKMPGTPDLPVWEIFSSCVQKKWDELFINHKTIS